MNRWPATRNGRKLVDMIDQLLTTTYVAGLQQATRRKADRGPRPRIRRPLRAR